MLAIAVADAHVAKSSEDKGPDSSGVVKSRQRKQIFTVFGRAGDMNTEPSQTQS